MKLIIAFTILLIASISFAQSQGELPSAPVYSHGKVKVTIQKSRIVRTGDRFDSVEENICTKELDINVWDIRQPEGQWGTSGVTCKTQYENKNIEAIVNFQAAIEMVNLHGEAEKTPVFSLMGVIVLADSDAQNSPTKSFSFVTLSKDLNTKSIVNVAGPEQSVVCDPTQNSSQSKNCTITNPEVINATVEFIGQ
ncbi:MAG TPA: hypothetical protein VF412_11340 [Bdellovibrio sp.]|uniref:hypothetical protein n=1 Tax=Bdellovibrio sp. TaxID=28201 RepID=UPI002EFFA80A